MYQAFTSTDGVIKKLRATYEYYLHGPLKRIELGDKLQGIDFVYNINGWLTQINDPDKIEDPGKDGREGEHADVKADVFGMVLDYYESSMNNLYSATAALNNRDLNPVHGLPAFGKAQVARNHQPLIQFFQKEDPSSAKINSGLKAFSAENARYKDVLTPD